MHSNTPYLDAWIPSQTKTAGRLYDLAEDAARGTARGFTGKQGLRTLEEASEQASRGLQGFRDAFDAGTGVRGTTRDKDLFKFDLRNLNAGIGGLAGSARRAALNAPLAATAGATAPELAILGAGLSLGD